MPVERRGYNIYEMRSSFIGIERSLLSARVGMTKRQPKRAASFVT
jgi:hypothetical protein